MSYDLVDQFEDWNDYINTPKTDKIQQFRSLKADAIVHIFANKEIASIARKAKIPIRVGTSHKAYHLLTCTHRINLHEENHLCTSHSLITNYCVHLGSINFLA